MKTIYLFCKQNLVFTSVAVLALLSLLAVPPSLAYLSYVNWQVLSLLFCLMAVIGGLRESGLFAWLFVHLLRRINSSRALTAILVFACFFLSMLVTNDVALVTFVPFSLVVLRGVLSRRQIAWVVVLQTLAANLGSMCTPIGNPQNLYLYLEAQMDLGQFVRLLLPFSLVSFLLLCGSLWLLPRRKLARKKEKEATLQAGLVQLFGLGLLFLLSLLTIGHSLDYRLSLLVTVLVLGLYRPRYFRYVDYVLLATFVAFFILIGNLSQLTFFQTLLQERLTGHEFLVALGASQIISNVPAAVLLSGFTDDYAALLLGTDIGGLGTLIASMASLISYGIYSRAYPKLQGYYLKVFTLCNLGYLLVLLVVKGVISG